MVELPKMRYAIVEDQYLMRQMLKDRIPGCVWEGSSVADLAKIPKIDLQIIDLELPDGNALDWLDSQADLQPTLILTSVKEDILVMRALRTSALGIVHKQDSLEVVMEAIKVVLGGGGYISKTFQSLRSHIGSDPNAPDKLLSNREQEVLTYVGKGLSNAEVAQMIGLKESSVASHKQNIMRKLGLNTHPELMRYAAAKGFCKVGI